MRHAETGDYISLPKLRAGFSTEKWNRMLTEIRRKQDLEKIARIIRQLDVGMRHLAREKLNDEKMCIWYLRLKNSLEKTARHIRMDLLSHDRNDPLSIHAKRNFDREFEAYLRKTRF